MNLSSILFITLKSLVGVLIFNILLVLICYSFGSYFNILQSFTWFGFKIIILPYSAIAFLISFVYFFKHVNFQSEELIDQENSEYASRMEKYHQKDN